MGDTVTAKFHCKKCGPTILEIADPVTDDSIVKCKSCQTEFGRWGDVKAKAMKAAAGHVRAEAKKALRGIKGIKFK